MTQQIDKYFAGELTETEKLELLRHIEKNVILKDEMADMQNILALSGMMDREGDDLLTAIKIKELEQRINKRKIYGLSISALKYVVAATLLFCAWFLSEKHTLDKHKNESILIEAPQGQRVFITLADGTKVWLSSRTKLTAYPQFNNKERVIELDGEGFFVVEKDENRPFIVKTKQYNVQVLGTQFNIFAYSNSKNFETDLLEGAVYIYDKDNESAGIYMKPDEKVYLKDGQLIKGVSTSQKSNFLINGIFTFEDKPLGEILARLELWYDVKFIVIHPEIKEYVFSGKFRQNDDIINILQAIKEVGKFKFRIISEKEIEIF